MIREGNYLYVVHSKGKRIYSFDCRKKKSKNCQATAKIDIKQSKLTIYGSHNHEPEDIQKQIVQNYAQSSPSMKTPSKILRSNLKCVIFFNQFIHSN